MEPLDNQEISSKDPCETGDIDQFNPKLIPLQRNSYLGESESFPTVNFQSLLPVTQTTKGSIPYDCFVRWPASTFASK